MTPRSLPRNVFVAALLAVLALLPVYVGARPATPS